NPPKCAPRCPGSPRPVQIKMTRRAGQAEVGRTARGDIIRAMRIFRNARPVVGMVHLLPLPGAPRARALSEIRAAARADADALARGGVDGILIENYGDAPFSGGSVEPQVVAAMAVLASEVRATSGLPIGINVLRNDARSALAVALASGASFIRV